MKNLILLILLSLITATNVLANDARADEVLKQAREAIGGERLHKGQRTKH